MKKIFFVAALIFTGMASAQTPAAPVPAASAATTANAVVTCNDPKGPKRVSASATGNGARAIASCGGTAAPRPKSAPSKQAAPIENAGTVRALAEVNIALRASAQTGAFMPVPAHAEDGKVYSDSSGNTYERHQAGSRLCRFMVNGQVRKEVFVQDPDPVKSKKQCDVLAMEFEATLLPTTQNHTPTAATLSQVPAASQAGAGSVTCELKFDGKVVGTTTTTDDAACRVWTLEQARGRGWIPKT